MQPWFITLLFNYIFVMLMRGCLEVVPWSLTLNCSFDCLEQLSMYVLSGKAISLLYFCIWNDKCFTLKQDLPSVSKVSFSDDIISVTMAFLKFGKLSLENFLLETMLHLIFQQPSIFSPLSEEKCWTNYNDSNSNLEIMVEYIRFIINMLSICHQWKPYWGHKKLTIIVTDQTTGNSL